MRKAYIQPEAELISLASLEDFLDASTDKNTDNDASGFPDSDGNDHEDKWN